MQHITVHKPTSLPKYMEVVQTLQRRARHALWFRGNSASKFKLVPTLYRHRKAKTQEELRKLERQLMARFRQRSLPYHSRDLRDDWEALFFMQHYGVPTRLLDWTENPLIALHFALMSAHAESTRRRRSGSCVIWVLDPFIWNETALKHVSYKDGPLSTSDEDLKGYAPSSTAMGNFPVALFGAHNSPRIVSQQGVFTIFGSHMKPMETLTSSGNFPGNALVAISISAGRIPAMRQSLLDQGITETVVFPDLDGLAKETKRFFGFEG
jgi:hypothetical protein